MHRTTSDVAYGLAGQQPTWDDPELVARMRAELAGLPPLVEVGDVRTLHGQLARVASGAALVVQCGDCVEDLADCAPGPVARKAALLETLAGALAAATGMPVLRVGRISGQFAKPRSQSFERVGELDLPVFRGHLVNGPEPDPASRTADPRRLLTGYHAASQVLHHLGWLGASRQQRDHPIWTSHEVLLLDYEVPQVRPAAGGDRVLTSTHWPWIGERTRHPDGAHVALLAGVSNPVACKVGPTMTTAELRALCGRLDPGREPGRLTLIARIGAEAVADRLPALVAAARTAGHPVSWLCDPMHANTVVDALGRKTRFLESIEAEIREFRRAVQVGGGIAGGLHLETTPDDVAECLRRDSDVDQPRRRYTSLCDPRLNPDQALRMIAAWS